MQCIVCIPSRTYFGRSALGQRTYRSLFWEKSRRKNVQMYLSSWPLSFPPLNWFELFHNNHTTSLLLPYSINLVNFWKSFLLLCETKQLSWKYEAIKTGIKCLPCENPRQRQTQQLSQISYKNITGSVFSHKEREAVNGEKSKHTYQVYHVLQRAPDNFK